MTSPRLVLAVGNPDRGDDGIGLAAARAVAALRLPDVEVTGPVQPVDLPLAWRDAEVAVVLDASRTPGGAVPPGTVRVVDAATGPPPAPLHPAGTHGFGLADAVDLAGALGTLPRRLVLVLVEGSAFRTGDGPSPAVLAARDVAVRAVLAALGPGQPVDVPEPVPPSTAAHSSSPAAES